METLTIAIIVITLTVILFSSISYSYVSPDPNAQVPIDMLNSTGKPRPGMNIPISRSQIDKVGKVNPKASTFALYNLPEKDEYMTTDLRNQIDTLRTQYYYDNCQKVNKNNNANFFDNKAKFTDLCTDAQVSFKTYNYNMG